MSRFFATGSDSESDTSTEEEQVQRAPAAAFTVSFWHWSLIAIRVECRPANRQIINVYSLAMRKKKRSVLLDQQRRRDTKRSQISSS